ncbi:MAG: NAD-dependent epimerase/dehydratase family protein [Candidatus Eisenbacteria bacterium]|nr:NAD-dependent epimerase/dehydratase family protein [Candidatus Latescibacterota bacterium]MBD3301412.1 NAD-dependent epimerase/dehydratase family protein [Candidatus Eisenbacteria bacterium]
MSDRVSLESFYDGRDCLVTGGLGFLGSNLCRALVRLGARVTVVDSLIPEYGGNLWNVHDIEDRIEIQFSDVRDVPAMRYLVGGRQVIFNLAGQVSHVDSMVDPYTDLEINCRAQLSMLEACRASNRNVKILYAGTRQQYGRPRYLPVDEQHLVQPTDVNGINKMAGEWYHILYANTYGMRATSLRLTNSYGPGMLLKHGRQGFIPWFVRKILLGEPIAIYGTGEQKRDMNYVEDVIDAFLRAGATDATDGEVYNLGGDEVVSLLEFTETLIDVAGGGRYEVTPFPEEMRRIDIGDYYGSYEKLRAATGWEPRVPLRDGLARTLAYYRENRSHYIEPSEEG